jgi:MscS family membrane protein
VVQRTATHLDDEILARAIGPLRLAVALLVFRAGTLPLGLPDRAYTLLGALLGVASIFAVAWALGRMVDLIAEEIRHRLVEDEQLGGVALVNPGRHAVKVLIGVIAAVAAVDNLGFDVTALVAGLGVGGLAVALAAQKTVENLFGGVTLYADRPVRVGDFCRFGDQIGTVEEIGLRSTRVRTLERTLVSIPNADFSARALENYTQRDRMLLQHTIGLRYETTPEQLRYALVEIRRLLYAHPRVLGEPARVRFMGFGACSLDLEVFAYVDSRDWNDFLGVCEDVLLRIMDVVERAGTGFAFPSSTVYLGRDEGLDPERRAAAEREVAAWRERRELFLPSFPEPVIGSLRNTVAFPAEGAPKSG